LNSDNSTNIKYHGFLVIFIFYCYLFIVYQNIDPKQINILRIVNSTPKYQNLYIQ